MNFVITTITPPPGLATVTEMGRIAEQTLDDFQANISTLFRLQWEDPSSIQDKLDRMGTKAALVFDQHKDAVGYILRTHAREQSWNLNQLQPDTVSKEDLAAALANIFVWLFTHPDHPLTIAVLEKYPPSSFMPSAAYTINEDGTILLN